MENSVQHDGEYVLTINGSRDFGEISPEIANLIKRQAGKRSRLVLYKKSDNDTMFYVELTPSAEGDFYDVKTGLVTRKDFMKKKKPLWENQSGF